MKNVFLRILKEVGIFTLMLVILLAVVILTFRKQFPYGKEIPEADEYVSIDKNEYSVSSTDRLQGINSVTITHETNGNQITNAENDVRVQTGRLTPFGNIGSETDLPSERVGVNVTIGDDGQTYNESGEVLQYPTDIVDEGKEDITDIEDSENEDASSLIERRTSTDED